MGSNPCACALWVTHRAHRTCVELPSEPPHPPSTPLHPSSTSAGLHPNLHQHPAKHPAALNPTSHPRTSTCQLAPAETSASARVSVVRLTACARCCRADGTPVPLASEINRYFNKSVSDYHDTILFPNRYRSTIIFLS